MKAATNSFVGQSRRNPEKGDAKARIAHFDEIYAPFKPIEAEGQAGRCAQCGVPFCQSGCPLQNNIPDWLRLTAEGFEREAWEPRPCRKSADVSALRIGCAKGLACSNNLPGAM